MLASFRNLSKSKIGTVVMAVILVGILVGFALADAKNFGSGNLGFGMGSDSLAKVGNRQVGQREVSDAMQRRLQEVRQQNPNATYATIANDFDTILEAMIDQAAMIAFAEKNEFYVSKRLIDAEIAQIPGTKGLNGKFSDDAYKAFLAQRGLTDAEVRNVITGSILQRLMLTPVAVNARVSVGLASPYASMLLESRSGEAAVLPAEAFAAGLKPSDTQLQQYYLKNRVRYTIPEQRTLKLATISAASVDGVVASDKEIADYFNANQETYSGGAARNLTQVVVPDQKTAAAIAARARDGATLAAASAPAGGNAALSDLGEQSRADYASAAGDKVASAVFAAATGAIVGPIQSDFGWVVVKVNSAKAGTGKTLAQARGEIAAKLNADKRKLALEDLVDKVQTAIDEGSNFAESAAAAKLNVSTTPLVMVNGAARGNASARLPQNLANVLKAGFEIAPNDPPEIVSLPDNQGYVLVAPDRIVPAAAASLVAIRAIVERQWVGEQAMARAKSVAEAIAAKLNAGTPMAQAVAQAGTPLPAPRPISARRMQIANAEGKIPAAMQMLFSLAQGKARMVADDEGRGYYVVKADKVTPGNALLQPGLINEMQRDLQDGQSQEYARQFIAAIRKDLGLTRNEAAIAALKTRLSNPTS
ncbi:MAG: peptidyl-prolyl cis-trans isomerase [Sphingomicrobium sp.]